MTDTPIIPPMSDFNGLVGKRCQLEYLPTPRSRKWRVAWLKGAYTHEEAYRDAVTILHQDGWHTFRYTGG